MCVCVCVCVCVYSSSSRALAGPVCIMLWWWSSWSSLPGDYSLHPCSLWVTLEMMVTCLHHYLSSWLVLYWAILAKEHKSRLWLVCVCDWKHNEHSHWMFGPGMVLLIRYLMIIGILLFLDRVLMKVLRCLINHTSSHFLTVNVLFWSLSIFLITEAFLWEGHPVKKTKC